MAPTPVALEPAALIGATPASPAPHATLVEFGDFECPPCARASHQVEALLADRAHPVGFVFHEFPLPMHKHSHAAAVLAEEARGRGAFPTAYRLLYGLDARLDSTTLATERRTLGLSRVSRSAASAAESAVAADLELGNRTGVSGTPTFYLCRPGKPVLLVPDVRAVSGLVGSAEFGTLLSASTAPTRYVAQCPTATRDRSCAEESVLGLLGQHSIRRVP